MPMPAPGQAIPVQVNSPLPRSPDKKDKLLTDPVESSKTEGSPASKEASADGDLPPGWGEEKPAPGPVSSPSSDEKKS